MTAARSRPLAIEQLESRDVPAVFTVTSVADAGTGSLRQAITDANAKAGADTIIVADGTSCRHQIHDGTGREAIHVARVLAMSLTLLTH